MFQENIGNNGYLSLLGSSGSSLDYIYHNCTLTNWTPKQRRAYHRIMSGLTHHRGSKLRFLTLTMAEGTPKRKLMVAWRVFKERVKRLSVGRLIKMGYLKPSDIGRYYRGKGLATSFKFDYVLIRTEEGNGVLHVLYFGEYLPQKWVSDVWREITGNSYIVDIRCVRGIVEEEKGLCRYIIGKYLTGQPHFEHLAYSWGWVCKGFVKIWRRFGRYYASMSERLGAWRHFLGGGVIKLKVYDGYEEISLTGIKHVSMHQICLTSV